MMLPISCASSPWKKSRGIRPAMHPGCLRCSSVKYVQYSSSSRLVSRAPRRSRCDAGLLPRTASPDISRGPSWPSPFGRGARMPAVLRACAPVCGLLAEKFCSRFVLATEAVDTPTSEGARANLGQNIQPEAAKRTVVQTATLDTGRILHDHQQVTCEIERTGEISGLGMPCVHSRYNMTFRQHVCRTT